MVVSRRICVSPISVALPLFVVTMASQNIPGVAVIRASGYEVPISPLIGWTGIATLILAPFGGYALHLAAITAAICMGREAHDSFWSNSFGDWVCFLGTGGWNIFSSDITN